MLRKTALIVIGTASLGTLGAVAPVASTPASALETASAADTVEGYLGITGNGIGRLTRKFEEGLATCMKKEGFEYTPTGAQLPADAADGGASNRKAFVQKYGYGISTIVEAPKAGKADPNADYLSKLSAADRRSYFLALTGQDPDKSNPANGAPFNAKSCVGKVSASVFGNMVQVEALFSKYQDLEKRIDANTDVVRAMRDWSACMKKGGYTFAKDRDVPENFNSRLEKLYKKNANPGPTDLFGGGREIDVPGLKKLQADELATAKVDYDCSTKHLGARDKVAKDLRKTFITENKAGLDPLKKILGGK